MDIEISGAGVTIGDATVTGARDLESALGPPSRRERSERPIPGLEELGTPLDVAVWDDDGVMAGERFIAVATGANTLDEPIYPAATFAGGLRIEGMPLDTADLKMDPLRDDRFSLELPSSKVVVIADWKRAPTKVVCIGT